jgi:hypothetical protein
LITSAVAVVNLKLVGYSKKTKTTCIEQSDAGGGGKKQSTFFTET